MEHPVAALNLFTLIAVVVLLAGALLWFLRSRKNREAAKRIHGIDDPPGTTDVKPVKPDDPRMMR